MKIRLSVSSNKEQGFSLVDVVFAAAILGVISASLCTGFAFGFSLLRLTQENIRADQILVQKLETIRVYDWSKVTSGTFIPATQTESFVPGATDSPGVTYNIQVQIAPAQISESYSNTLRQVTATLTWVSSGVTRSRSMTTFVSQNGIDSL